LTDFYFKFLENKDILKLTPKDNPILTDFYNFVVKMNQDYFDKKAEIVQRIYRAQTLEEKQGLKEELELQEVVFQGKQNINVYQKIKTGLEVEFIAETNLKRMFNAHSTIDFNQDRIINFDVKQLVNSNNKAVRKAMFLLLFKISRKITEDNADSENPVSVIKVVDEFHLFIDGKDDYIFSEFYKEIKTVRKLGASLILITQAFTDLAKEKDLMEAAKSFISNTQYKILMKMTTADIQIINDSLGEKNALTNYEQNYILNAGLGQGVLIVSPQEKYSFNAKITKFALESFQTKREQNQYRSRKKNNLKENITNLNLNYITSLNKNLDPSLIEELKNLGINTIEDLKTKD
jgi:hypothetical protein